MNLKKIIKQDKLNASFEPEKQELIERAKPLRFLKKYEDFNKILNNYITGKSRMFLSYFIYCMAAFEDELKPYHDFNIDERRESVDSDKKKLEFMIADFKEESVKIFNEIDEPLISHLKQTVEARQESDNYHNLGCALSEVLGSFADFFKSALKEHKGSIESVLGREEVINPEESKIFFDNSVSEQCSYFSSSKTFYFNIRLVNKFFDFTKNNDNLTKKLLQEHLIRGIINNSVKKKYANVFALFRRTKMQNYISLLNSVRVNAEEGTVTSKVSEEDRNNLNSKREESELVTNFQKSLISLGFKQVLGGVYQNNSESFTDSQLLFLKGNNSFTDMLSSLDEKIKDSNEGAQYENLLKIAKEVFSH